MVNHDDLSRQCLEKYPVGLVEHYDSSYDLLIFLIATLITIILNEAIIDSTVMWLSGILTIVAVSCDHMTTQKFKRLSKELQKMDFQVQYQEINPHALLLTPARAIELMAVICVGIMSPSFAIAASTIFGLAAWNNHKKNMRLLWIIDQLTHHRH